MPVLKNARWELMAQGLAQNKTADEAYEFAGYNKNRGNAARLKANEAILARVAEIQAPALRKVEVTVERLVEEARRIAFHNVTSMIRVEKGQLILKDTDELPEDFTAAIAGLKKTKDGIEVSFHDKQAAIAFLGRHKGMLKENVNLTVELSLADLVNASYQTAKKQSDTDKK